MTRRIQILRGTEAQNDAFTGAVGELTMDTTNNEIRIHDGSTVGGHKIGGTIQNQNTAAGATNPIYDWVGTAAEYEAQNVATLHPDWVCYITDDIGLPATEIGQITEDVNDLKEHTVVEFQEPTSANGYTWYRKYADGWVEQGGTLQTTTNSLTFPIEMADTDYQWYATATPTDIGNFRKLAATRTTTGLTGLSNLFGTSAAHASAAVWDAGAFWQVSGMAA